MDNRIEPENNAALLPARLHVLLASNAKRAIVIRRGPSKQTCVLAWDREKHKFTVGQWLKGRLYPKRSDISPDGKHWIYFAMDGKWHTPSLGAWTAVAKYPWLKALTFLPKGDCWHGGGLFVDNSHYWLNDGTGHQKVLVSNRVLQDLSHKPAYYFGGECLTIYYNRLLREGWRLVEELQYSADRNWPHSATVFEKPLRQHWTLRKICHEQVGAKDKGKGCYWDEHALRHDEGHTLSFPDWEWAEWADGGIYFARHGCLYKTHVKGSSAIREPILLHDFNDYRFEPKFAPY